MKTLPDPDCEYCKGKGIIERTIKPAYGPELSLESPCMCTNPNPDDLPYGRERVV